MLTVSNMVELIARPYYGNEPMLCWILIFHFVLIAVTLFLVLLVELWIIIGLLVLDMESIVSVWIICAEIFALLYRYNLTVRCYHDF